MPLNLLTLPQKCYPSAADGVTLTAAGSAWGDGSWVEIIASTSGAKILSGITLRTTFNETFANVDGEVDIGVGASSSEVRIATIKFASNNFGTSGTGPPTFTFPIGVDAIPNNSRISARLRVSSTAAYTLTCSVSYYDKPISGQNTYLTTANPYLPLPSAGVTLLTANGTPWVSGSYAQIRTNSGAALLLIGMAFKKDDSGSMEIDIATGAAASESVITTLAITGSGNPIFPSFMYFPNPLDNIGVNVRVAARVRSSIGSSNVRVGLVVLEKPI